MLDHKSSAGQFGYLISHQSVFILPQGKTTTMSKFLATLLLMSPVGGNLVFLYSTSLDRAQEVLRAAKVIIDWVLTDPPSWAPKFTKVRDNERLVSICNGRAVNTAVARPKRIESCRGDAARCVMVDEVAFVDRMWWQRFLVPTFNNFERRFTLITTPPPKNGFFQAFVHSIKDGSALFGYINHSLICEACASTGVAGKCVHNLMYLPPWKSYFQLVAIQKTASRKDRVALLEEIYGIVAEREEGFFPEYLIESFRKAPQQNIDAPIRTIWLAIDPASHQSSEIGLAAISYLKGHVIVLGTASVKVGKGNMKDCCNAIVTFAEMIVDCRKLDTASVIPIIECNHSEVVAREILNALQETLGAKVAIPWSRKNIQNVSEALGVYTTAKGKLASVLLLRKIIAEERIRPWSGMATVCDSVFEGSLKVPVSTEEAFDTLCEQLGAFRDHPDGSISGKEVSIPSKHARSLLTRPREERQKTTKQWPSSCASTGQTQ